MNSLLGIGAISILESYNSHSGIFFASYLTHQHHSLSPWLTVGIEAAVEVVEVVGDAAVALLKEGEEDVVVALLTVGEVDAVVVIKITEVVGVVVPLLMGEEVGEDEETAVSVAEVVVMALEATFGEVMAVTFVAASAVLEVAVEVSTAEEEEDIEEVEVEDHLLTSHAYSRKSSSTCVRHVFFILILAALDLFPSLTTPSRSSRMRW